MLTHLVDGSVYNELGLNGYGDSALLHIDHQGYVKGGAPIHSHVPRTSDHFVLGKKALARSQDMSSEGASRRTIISLPPNIRATGCSEGRY